MVKQLVVATMGQSPNNRIEFAPAIAGAGPRLCSAAHAERCVEEIII